MIAFLARRHGCFAVAPFLPGKHRFADMDAPVVDNIRLYHLFTIGFQHFAQRMPQQVVAYMSQMEWFVGIGRRILHHIERRLVRDRRKAVIGPAGDKRKRFDPGGGGYRQVQESVDDIEVAD